MNLHINEDNLLKNRENTLKINREESKKITGFASIDKPWMKYHKPIEKEDEMLYENATSFYDYFWKILDKYDDDKKFVEFNNQEYTKKDIDREVEKHVKMFVNLGIKHGDTVSFMMLNVPEIVYMFLALNKIGAVANLIKFDETPNRINHMTELTKSKYFFVSEVPFMLEAALNSLQYKSNLEKIISVPLIPGMPSLITKEKENSKLISYDTYQENNLKDISEEISSGKDSDSAFIVYTGGSTGTPKGVNLTNKNLKAMAYGMKYSNFGFTANKKSLNVLPPAIAYYLNATAGLMMCGLEVVFIPNFEISDYPNLINKYKPNLIFAGPVLLKALQNSSYEDYSYLSDPMSGGDKYYESEEAEFDEVMSKRGAGPARQGYGSSEETAVATCNPLNAKKLGSIGIPMHNVVVSIFEYGTDKEIPYGKNKEGEICITGPTVMKEYLDNIEETNNVLKRHSDGLIWAHTDDLGVLDEDGFLFHRGRAKRMLTRSGGKVWLPSIEEGAKSLGIIKDCCATKLNDETEREVPVLNIVLKDDGEDYQTIIEQLETYIASHFPATYVPKYYVIRESLPYSATNKKMDFKALESEDILDTDNYEISGKVIRPRQKRLIKE